MTPLLEKARKLNSLMQRGGNVSFDEVADLLRDLTSCNIYVVGNDGAVLGYALQDGFECDVMRNLVLENMKFPSQYMDFVNGMQETHSNISHKEHMCSFDETKACKYGEKRTTIIPIRGNRERLGTLILARYDRDFNDDDLLLGEYAAAVIGIQLLHNREAAMEERIRKEAVIKIAFTTLSFSEWEAIVGILTELKSNEGILIASKVADRLNITRSVIVNAMRKFQSAGLIETKSLGMKGTYIKIRNEYLLDEIKKHAKEVSPDLHLDGHTYPEQSYDSDFWNRRHRR
ncbi:MAG: GTP-sensing pleiotropic transcriptional regulator CodY [Succiniclasticum sp.]|jgi:transcriptional pleiotropic repressor